MGVVVFIHCPLRSVIASIAKQPRGLGWIVGCEDGGVARSKEPGPLGCFGAMRLAMTRVGLAKGGVHSLSA